MGDLEGTLQYEYDDISMKAKPILIHFGGTFETLRLDEKSFLKIYIRIHNLLGL